MKPALKKQMKLLKRGFKKMKNKLINYLLDIISGNKKGLIPAILRILLILLSYIYRLAVMLRNLLYDKDIIKQGRVAAKTISIGNITTGGTGKTPAVEAFATELKNSGKDIVIISRGYKGDNQEPLVVSNGEKILVGAKFAGDEAFMLANKLPEIPVVICRDRLKAASYVQAEFNPDIILLDDSFQHRKIIRDYDIVLIDATNPFGYNHLLPGGLLREPKSSLKRADGFIITRVDQVSNSSLNEIINQLKSYNDLSYIYLSNHVPSHLQSINGEKLGLNKLNNKDVIAFSGLGNPGAFEASLQEQGCNLVKHFIFPDHHIYTREDFKQIVEKFASENIDYLITTGKDIVKLDDSLLDFLSIQNIGLYSFEIKMAFKDQTGQSKNIATRLMENIED